METYMVRVASSHRIDNKYIRDPSTLPGIVHKHIVESLTPPIKACHPRISTRTSESA